MPIKLIGLDLDGTTLNSQKQLSNRTRKALEHACARGVAVLPVTGRPRAGLSSEILSVPGIRYAITSNGGAVYDLTLNQELLVHPIDKQAALRALADASALHAITDIYMEGQAYTSAETFDRLVSIVPSELKQYFRATRTPVENQFQWLERQTRPIEKLTLFFSSPADRRQAWKFFEASGCFEVASSIVNNLELNQSGVNKGSALLALARRLGIRREEIMACGDSYNDIPMLRAAGTGVAVANAAPEVLAAACAHTDSNDGDGVAKAIERYVLA